MQYNELCIRIHTCMLASCFLGIDSLDAPNVILLLSFACIISDIKYCTT